MTTADVKASLAAAYASGHLPRFVSVSPNGRDEVWALADVAFVLTVVPPNASAELEYALRTRREAYLTGQCPDCSATPTVDEVHDVLGPVPMATPLFPHSIRCPGRDEAAKVALDAHYVAAADATPDQRFQAASIATRGKTGVPSDLAIPMVSNGAESVALHLLKKVYRNGDFCGHLKADPAQTSHVLIAEGLWRCDECFLHHSQEVLETGARLPGDEEFTCDLCREADPEVTGQVL